MAKKLTANVLKNIAKSGNEKKNILVRNALNGEEYEVALNTTFRRTAIEDAAMEYLELIKELQLRTVLNDALIKDSFKIFHILIIKNFTNVPLPNQMSVEEVIAITRDFADTGLTEQIFKHIPQSEIDKVMEIWGEVKREATEIVHGMIQKATIKDTLKN